MKIISSMKSKLLIIPLIMVLAMVAILFFAQGQVVSAYAADNTSETGIVTEYSSFGKASIEDDFADDRILVVLNRQETLRFKGWGIQDFSEIGIVSVENLTASSGDILNADISRHQFGESSQTRNVRALVNTEINADEFKTVLRFTLKESSKENVLYAIEKLRGRKDIISAEPDYAFQMTSTNPDDTYFSAGNQWGLNGTNGIRAPQAWSMATGSNTVMVGVIDSGIQADHPDLQGRVNTALSRDFTLPAPHIPATVTDTNGHGTHCAGIIGAQGNNGIGITGVAQNIQLVSLRISQQGGTAAAENTFASHVIMAINFAATENIPILSCSNCTQNFLGSAASLTAFETAVTNYTGLYINAAGNNARDNDANTGGFPRAQFRPNNFLSVGSLDSNGSLSSFSNWGINTVDIYAPGGSILSTWPTALTAQHDSGKPNYRTISGTSMATPHVAGVAALMLSINPNLTPQQLRNNIRDSATIVSLTTPNTSFWPWQNNSITFNGRCLNAETAVGVVATFSTRALSTTTIEIVGTALNRQLIGSIVIPETLDGRTVTQIEASAFSGQTGMSQITIPASITNIGSNAFENCTSLINVALPSNLTSIGSSAFKGCASLDSIVIPDTVANVDSNSFENCTSLTNVALPNNLTSIGNSAFKGCTSLTSITIPFVGQSRTATGNDAKFNYIFGTIPNQLRTVIITSGTNIPQDAFFNCSYLTSITIPDSVTSIGSNAFNGCTNLSSLTIPNSVTSLGSDVLMGCSGLTSIKIPFVGQSRTAIDHYAKFGYLFGSTPYDEGESIDQNGITYFIPINLETVEVTSGTNIPQDAFYNFSWLENISIPNTVTNIGSNAFYNCYSLTNTTMPNALTSIGSNAFYYCLSLTSFTIPDSVASIGSSAFGMCSSLQSISVPFVGQSKTATGNDAKFAYVFGTLPNQLKEVSITDVTTIPQDAFYNCSHLSSITIPDSVTSIGSSAFYGCYNLTSFIIPSSVTSIGSNAFYYCLSLLSITIPSSVTSLGSNVFYGCTHLSSLSYHVGVASSGYYNIQIENISSVTVKIDGVTNYFPNDIQQKYLTAGNHTILAECANIGAMVSFPIIAATEYIPYYIDIDNIYIVFYDGPEMQYATYVVSSLFYQAYNFDLINRSITFTSITCEWELENLNYQEFHLVQMFIGENYYYENGGIYFECYDGYQVSSNTWSYSATAYNITITFSQSEWDQNVHQL